MTKQDKLDRWLGVICVIGGIVWVSAAKVTIQGGYEPFVAGPQMFPVLLGVILFLLGLNLLFCKSASLTKIVKIAEADITPFTAGEVRIVILTFIVLIGYGWLLDKLGFLIATPIVIIAAFTGILQDRSWKLIISMTLGLTIGSYVLFGKIIGTYLPRGAWL